MTTLIKINLPMPKLTRTPVAGKESVYNLAELQIGEAYQLADVIDVKKSKSKLQSAIGAYRSRTGDSVLQFAVRSWKLEDGKDAVAVWRIADKVEEVAAPAAE